MLLWLSPYLHVASIALTPRVAAWHAWMQFVVPAYLFAAVAMALRRCVAGGHKPGATGTVLLSAIVPTALGFTLAVPMAPVLLAALRDLMR